MRILDHIHLVGSGAVGLSNEGDCHVYLLDADRELVLIDAGCGAETDRILANIEHAGFDPMRVTRVLLTHAHRDHANGCHVLRGKINASGNALQVTASAGEAHLLANGTPEELGLDTLGLGHLPRSESFPYCTVDVIAHDGETFNIGDLQITAIEVPGHNPACLCYLVQVDGRRALFCGDVVYHGGVISLGNWLGCDLQHYRRSLRKLAGLGVDALLPGHLLWTVSGGQAHIDKAIRAFDGLWPPPNINLIP